ncbi:MAG TPA: ThiF family adenylyltransferase [Acidimicrobiales bacterium]|nr:ThiF family adenylyltransferase [Acidimicrobiales bacterium]
MRASTPVAWADVELRLSRSLWDVVRREVLGDADSGIEAGAGVLFCGIVRTPRCTRLLGREFVRAVDGVDYVDSAVGHGALAAGFTLDAALRAESEGLIPLFVHGHDGDRTVGFSQTDLDSHRRGYPALALNANGPIGALVVARRAVEIDLYFPGGVNVRNGRAVVVGSTIERFGSGRQGTVPGVRAADRHARLFGEVGLRVLAGSKVVVIGAGGVGILLIQWLSMLGIGQLVVIDPGRVKEESRSRLPGATRRDARGGDSRRRGPEPLLRAFGLVGTQKVLLAKRLARKSAMGTNVTAIHSVVADPVARRELIDSDFIVLAADSDAARYAANRLAHQYLVPMVQAGSKVQRRDDGTVADVFAVTRPVLPDQGCLRCAGLYSAAGLSYETAIGVNAGQRDYGTGEPAPSVAGLNAIAASLAVAFVQFSLTGLRRAGDADNLFVSPLDDELGSGVSSRDPACPICGDAGVTGWGDLKSHRIPSPQPSGSRSTTM